MELSKLIKEASQKWPVSKGVIYYMRPGRTWTDMSSYRSSYILFMHLRGTGLKTNSERSDFVSVSDLTQVIFVLV